MEQETTDKFIRIAKDTFDDRVQVSLTRFETIVKILLGSGLAIVVIAVIGVWIQLNSVVKSEVQQQVRAKLQESDKQLVELERSRSVLEYRAKESQATLDALQKRVSDFTLKQQEVIELTKTMLEKGGSNELVMLIQRLKDADETLRAAGGVAELASTQNARIDALSKQASEWTPLIGRVPALERDLGVVARNCGTLGRQAYEIFGVVGTGFRELRKDNIDQSMNASGWVNMPAHAEILNGIAANRGQ